MPEQPPTEAGQVRERAGEDAAAAPAAQVPRVDGDLDGDRLPEEPPPEGEQIREDGNDGRQLRNRTLGAVAAPPARAPRVEVRLPTDIAKIRTHLDLLATKLKGKGVPETMSLRIIRATLALQYDFLRENQRREGEARPAKVRKNVCTVFGLSERTYTKIISDYLSQWRGMGEPDTVLQAYESNERGNRSNLRERRIPYTKAVSTSVQLFVRTQRKETRRVTGRQVLDHLVQEGYLVIPEEEEGQYKPRDFSTAFRSVRRWLDKHDYRRGKRKGNVVLKEEIAVKRDIFLTEFFRYRMLPKFERFREVYLDESYIHQHYHKFDDSLWDPSDEQDLQVGKMKHKGNRYCFLCAIQGPDPREAEVEDHDDLEKLVAQDRGGLVPGSVWSFCPQHKQQHKGDYHKVFHSSNFIQWWKDQLLPNLKQPSLIIMDNAKYHCTYPDNVPKSSARKEEIRAYLLMNGVPVDRHETVAVLKAKAKDYIRANEKFVVVSLAEAQGHRVLFQPPYHSDFQPIELLWAKLKGNIGRQYDDNTTMADLKIRLDKEFEDAKGWHRSVEGFIRKASSIMLQYYLDSQEEDGNNQHDDSSDEESVADSEEGDVVPV